MTQRKPDPCRVCGSDVDIVAISEVPQDGDQEPAREPVRRCTNPTCETNDRNDVDVEGRPTP